MKNVKQFSLKLFRSYFLCFYNISKFPWFWSLEGAGKQALAPDSLAKVRSRGLDSQAWVPASEVRGHGTSDELFSQNASWPYMEPSHLVFGEICKATLKEALSVRLSDSPSFCPSVHPSVCPSISPLVRPSISLSIGHSVHQSVHRSVRPSVHKYFGAYRLFF